MIEIATTNAQAKAQAAATLAAYLDRMRAKDAADALQNDRSQADSVSPTLQDE